MGNANSSNHTSSHHEGAMPRRRGRRMNLHRHHQDILHDRAWRDNDQSFSSTEANEPPHDHEDALPSPKDASLPIYWNVRLRAVDESHNECPVCATEFEVNDIVALLPCGHYFCKDCMMQWMTYEKCTCPLCRHDLQASAMARRRMYARVTCTGKILASSDQNLRTIHSLSTDDILDQNFDLIMAKMLNDKDISAEESSDSFSFSKAQ
jgi:hypothetical protein